MVSIMTDMLQFCKHGCVTGRTNIRPPFQLLPKSPTWGTKTQTRLSCACPTIFYFTGAATTIAILQAQLATHHPLVLNSQIKTDLEKHHLKNNPRYPSDCGDNCMQGIILLKPLSAEFSFSLKMTLGWKTWYLRVLKIVGKSPKWALSMLS